MVLAHSFQKRSIVAEKIGKNGKKYTEIQQQCNVVQCVSRLYLRRRKKEEGLFAIKIAITQTPILSENEKSAQRDENTACWL